jgi:hypothetical protein
MARGYEVTVEELLSPTRIGNATGISALTPWQRTPGAPQRHPPAATPRPRRLRRVQRGAAAPLERSGARRHAVPRRSPGVGQAPTNGGRGTNAASFCPQLRLIVVWQKKTAVSY